jgi:hypothetical protein
MDTHRLGLVGDDRGVEPNVSSRYRTPIADAIEGTIVDDLGRQRTQMGSLRPAHVIPGSAEA